LGRRIIVLSDGTGNSAGKVFRTNVWRVYQALDLTSVGQIARYDDGVGTSKFKPLAILAGAVGWGLKRNILDLYTFLCRNYDPDDELYGFGFSRGAFTIRVLIKFVLAEGLVCDFSSQDDLRAKAKFLYRRFRQNRKTRLRIEVVGRWIRDFAILIWYILTRSALPTTPRTMQVKSVKFVGLWDTVDAYGLPIRELKQGVDKYLWPLALEDRDLDSAVEKACHALSIDDRRQTFHPLLWNEVDSAECPPVDHTDLERLTQVWFAGVHSNIGGGYPDDSLSYIPLRWIISEAQKQGLKFDSAALAQYESVSSPFGRIYDSRSGFGSYYRYDPRRLDPPTDSQGAQIPWPKIHSSVLWRMAFGSDAYAPLSLPSRLRVVGVNDHPTGLLDERRENHQTKNIYSLDEYSGVVTRRAEALIGSNQNSVNRSFITRPSDEALSLIWDTVWWRRIVYFATLAATLCLLALPFWPSLSTLVIALLLYIPLAPVIYLLPNSLSPSNFAHLIEPFVSVAVEFFKATLPGLTKPWVDAFNTQTSTFCLGIILVICCLSLGSLIDRRIQDRALAAWNPKWRAMRHLWSKETSRPRTVAAVCVAAMIAGYIRVFFVQVVRTDKCYVDSHSYLNCAPSALYNVLTNDFLGLDIVFRFYFIIVLLFVTMFGLWLCYMITIRFSSFGQTNEIPGFFLWIANHIRLNRRLVRMHAFLVNRVIPLFFACGVVITSAYVTNRVLFGLSDVTGLYCEEPSKPQGEIGTEESQNENQTSDQTSAPVVIEQNLSDFCAMSSAKLQPFTDYEVVINYWDDPTDTEGGIFSSPRSFTYVPPNLRRISLPTWALPLRRRLDAPWHVMIARDGQLGAGETVLDQRSTVISSGSSGDVYFYVNEPVIGLPFIYDWYYRGLHGTAQITLTPKSNASANQ
jgi:uncharacterized protein (DUF2235 family)